MKVNIIPVGNMQANCYVVRGEKTSNALLIDPGDEYPKIKSFLEKENLTACFIVHTHGHIDHIQADNGFHLPVYAHRLDVELLRDPEKNLSNFLSSSFRVKEKIIPLEDAQDVVLDDLSLKVIHTPGHTPGGICLLSGNAVFTGDTLFAGSVGRTDFPGASSKQLIKSIEDRLLSLNDQIIVYPGHGPSTTIGKERRKNPFLCRI